MAGQAIEYAGAGRTQKNELAHLFWNPADNCAVVITRNESGQAVASRHPWDHKAQGDLRAAEHPRFVDGIGYASVLNISHSSKGEYCTYMGRRYYIPGVAEADDCRGIELYRL